MSRSCRQCSAPFEVTDEDLAFLQKVSPVIGGVRYDVPPPTLCPDCRSQRRMTWRNERSLYTRPCGLCAKNKVSAIASESPMQAYCRDCFYGDGWDAESYGRDYDFSKTFRENMESLMRDVPLMMLYQSGTNENCDYINFAGDGCRNCYLIFNSGRSEDCYYSRGLVGSKDCADILIGNENELCYECVNCSSSYGLLFSQNSSQCVESAFLFNCQRCTHCFGCTNLVQKEYHLFNKPCTPDEFATAMAGLRSHASIVKLKERFEEIRRSSIHRATSNINAENCTGDCITASKNCHDCFEIKGAEDCRWLTCSKLCKDSRDLFGFGYDSELLYECVATGLSTSTVFSFTTEVSSNCLYCLYSTNIHNCFACVSLRQKKYCILNKQYTKEEYEALAPKIIDAMRRDGAWGEFLSQDMSPFAYNETVAKDYFPLTRDEAVAQGFRWNAKEPARPQTQKTVSGADLPNEISGVTDDILEWSVECAATGRPFRIIKQELDFYRKMHLPVPRLHPDERHRLRWTMKNPARLWTRPCMKCGRDIQTTYAPDRPETVYCEDCYAREVY